MSLRWLSATIGVKFRPGLRRRMAPEAQRSLTAEIGTDVLTIHRVWLRNLVRDPDVSDRPEPTVVAWIDTDGRADVAAWLAGDDAPKAYLGTPPEVRTDWIFLPALPEAILIGVVEGQARGGDSV